MSAASGSLAITASTSQPVSTTKGPDDRWPDRAPLAEEHAYWLENKRKIPCEIATKAPLGSIGRDLAFEFRKNGKLIYRKLRKESQTGKSFARDRAGVPTVMWNVDCLTEPSLPGEPLVITEGEIDALSWMAAGLTQVVSVPDGAQLTKRGEGKIIPEEDKPFAYLWDGDQLTPGLDKFKRIILSTDNDEKGQILRDELAVRLGRMRCWFVDYPEGCKDANDVLMRYGAAKLTELMADAKPLVPNQLVPFSHIPERPYQLGINTGWSQLDPHLKLQFPELMVVTGTPNAGKSVWTINYVCNLARLYGIRTAILQFEDTVERNRSQISRYAQTWRQAGNKWAISETWLDDQFRTIAPAEEEDQYDLEWLKEAIKEAAKRHDCKVVLIDPFNEIEHLWSRNETETQYINNCLRELKKLARELQVAIIIVTHPSKQQGSAKGIEEWTLYDAAGSAAWNNKADHGVIIWREDSRAMETYVKVCKSKNYETMGYPGTVTMEFDPSTSMFKCR